MKTSGIMCLKITDSGGFEGFQKRQKIIKSALEEQRISIDEIVSVGVV